MNVLLINLTRFGDLLQMQPVILGLKAKGHRVGLLCLENFAPAAALLQGVDHVTGLPGGSLLAGLDKDWRLALAALGHVLTDLHTHFPVEQVINTTATLGARLLARRLAPQAQTPILGFGLDAEGFGISGDMWATFLQGASAERLNCPFNIVDMFRAAAGVGKGKALRGLKAPSPAVLQAVDAQMPTMLAHVAAPGHTQGNTTGALVAFQLGASEGRRQWPVEHFVRLGVRLWREKGLCPLLLGSGGERHLAEAYAAASAALCEQAPFVDAVGSTDVPQLAGLLLRSRLLVSNDTGTMHLAAGLSVPVLAIFLATAQPWDTGPYMPGCCCLEPALDCHPCPFHQPCPHAGQPCLTRIDADTVFALVGHFVDHGFWPRLEQHQVRIWQTEEDLSGFADLRDLSGHEMEERAIWLRQQRYFYRHILDGTQAKADLCPSDVRPLSAHFRQQVGTALRQVSDLLLLLEEQTLLLQRLPSAKAGQGMLATCNRIRLVLEQCPPLMALGHLWLVLSQEQGGQIESFMRMAAHVRHNVRQWQCHLA